MRERRKSLDATGARENPMIKQIHLLLSKNQLRRNPNRKPPTRTIPPYSAGRRRTLARSSLGCNFFAQAIWSSRSTRESDQRISLPRLIHRLKRSRVFERSRRMLNRKYRDQAAKKREPPASRADRTLTINRSPSSLV